MLTSRIVSGSVLLVAASLLACGDDAASSTSSSSATGGGAGQGGAGAGGADGGATSAGGAGAGGAPSCATTTEIGSAIFTQGPNSWLGVVTPAIGAGAADLLTMSLPPGATGTLALAPVGDRDDCGVTAACLDVGEDANMATAARWYRHASGTIELGSTSPPYYVTGTISDVTLVEATLGTDGVWADVAGGACLHIASLAFELEPPVAGWTCAPFVYDEVGQAAANPFCDCACGAIDPDCADTTLTVRGCAMGQGCVSGACQ